MSFFKTSLPCVSLLFLLSFSACTPNPDIDNTLPADLSEENVLDTTITVELSREVENSVLNEYEVTVTNSLTQAQVTGTTSHSKRDDRSIITFSPSAPLDENTTYQASYARKASLSGQGEIENYDWVFKTRARSWTTPQSVGLLQYEALGYPFLKMDAAGNLLLVNAEYGKTNQFAVSYNLFNAAQGKWIYEFDEHLIQAGTQIQADSVTLEMAPNGIAFLLWTETERITDPAFVTKRLKMRRYLPAQDRWESEELLAQLPSVAPGLGHFSPKVAVEENGSALFSWTFNPDQNTAQIISRYLDVKKGWSLTPVPANPKTDLMFLVSVAEEGPEGFVGIFQKYDPVTSSRSMWSARFSKTTGLWTSPDLLVDTPDLEGYSTVKFALNPKTGSGNFYWVVTKNEVTIKAKRYQSGAWHPIQIVDTFVAPLMWSVAMNATSSMVVYHKYTQSETSITTAYQTNGQWKLETQDTDPNALRVEKIADTKDGDVILVWSKDQKLLARRFQASAQAWTDIELIDELVAPYSPYLGSLGISPSGEAALVYFIVDEQYTAHARLFSIRK